MTAKARLGAGTHYFRITSRDGRPRPYMLFPRVDVEANRFDEDCLMRGSSQSDPLYGCQWYLNNTGQYPGGADHDINVEGVWATTMGEGVNVAVVDQGMDFGHEDLKDNISEAGSHDYGPDNPWDPEREFHGTAVAGLIAAADNIVGGRGVAPRATLYGRRRHTNTVAETADAMIRDMSEVAVSNNSWGPPDNGQVWFASRGWEMAVERGVKEGYDGKGIFYVWAGGNGHPFDNSNFDGLTSHYAVTAVCAVDHDDDRAIYSERGANLWVCAPSSGDSDDPEVTTTRNTNLSATRYTKYFGGTSAAAPMVSGVAALLRSVYPALTWRDLKLILAGSARHNDPSDSGWEQGALRYDSADEHYRFNHNYGFGVVDAGAAMELADGWTSPPPWREVSATSDETAEITDRSTVTTRLVLDPYVEFVEFIAIEPTISHTYYRDLHMELTSPSGVTSVLSVAAPVRLVDAEEWVELTPRFGSAKHLGEDAAGEWTLSVTDKIRVDEGTLHSWKLTAYGHGYIPGFPGIRVTVSGDGTITVLWEAPGGVPVDIGGSAITGYDLRYVPRDADGGADPSGWTVVEGVWSAGSLQHTLSDLDTGARYYVGVRAVNGAGAGPWSESFPAATKAEAPGAPTITGVVSGNTAVTVFWAAPDDDGAADITAYDLRYIETSADETVEGGWTVTEDVWTSRDGGAYEYELGGLETGVGYDVEIRAVNRVGDGAWSATAMQAPREVPGAPAVGSVTAGRQALTVGWVTPQVTGGSAITSYDVRHILSDAADKAAANWTVESGAWTSDSGDLEYTITGLEGGAGYDVGVRAINSVGDGSWSDTVTGTTSLSDDATLSALAGVRLKPAFDSGTMSYTATVGYTVTRVTVRATSNYHRATVDFLDGDGNPLADADSAAPGHQVDLSVGNYIVGVKVTAQDGVTTLTYTVTVTREDEDLTLTPAASNPVAPFPSEVSYFLRFTGYWTDRDTPEGVPSGAGFSPLIGAVHNAAAVFLRSGGRASPGVEEMAETGNQSTLIDDFREEFDAGNVSLVIKGNRQIVHISSAAFDAIPMSTDHPLVTLVTRLTPSHDWFTGVSGLSLLDASGRWRRTHGVDIFPWDAGTEQGNDFSSSPDDETIPQGLITSISGVGLFTTDRIARLEFILKTVTTERTVAENTPEGGNIGLPVTPFTTSGTVNYTLGGPDKDSFDLDNSTGQLRAKPGVTYDRERRPSYTVTITYGAVVTTVNIEVRDVDEAPTISGDATVNYRENGTTPVGTYTASDPENAPVDPLSLLGDDADDFELSEAGRLTFKSPPDYESKNSYKITLSTSDGNFTGTLDVMVTVTDVNETPAVSGPEEVDYVENGIGQVAGYSADDPEDDDITWSLAGTDHGDFEISASGELTFSQKPDYEDPADSGSNNEYLVTVQASDGRRTGTLAVVVTVTDVNEPAVVSGDRAVVYAENRSGGVATYGATDPEEETVTWSLAGADRDVLAVTDGVLTFRQTPNHESPVDSNSNNVYLVTVRAWDGNSYGTLPVTITVTDVNEAPVISVVIVGGVIDVVDGEASRDYAEGRTDRVGLFFASDPENNPVTLSLVGSDEDVFELSGSGPSGSCVSGSCELGFGELPDFESPADSGRDNVYEVTVRAGDGTNYGTRDVVVTVTNVDEDGTVSLSSVQPQVGTELGAVLSDPDGSVTAVGWEWERSLSSAGGWSPIVAATEDAYTPVDGDERYFLRVMASYSDGQGSGKTAGAVSANRVQEAPREPNTAPYFPSSETGRREVDENTLTGREFGEAVAAIDDNVGDTLTYRLEGGDAASFRIGESSGRLLTEAVLDYEKKRSYSMMLTVTDTSGETDSIRVRVMVIDVDEPPDLSGPVAVDYAENRRDTVASYTADDPEGARIEWTLAGADPDDFAISRGGVLTFGSPPDYEAPTGSGGYNTYSVTVQASDGTYTPTPSRTVTVSVTNQEEKGTVTLTPARPDVDVPVSAVLVDPDRGVSNRVWRWERSQNNRDWTPIPGAVEDSYTPTTADRGHYLRVVVTYDDAEGPTKDATAATAGRVPNPTRPPPPPPPSPPPSPPPGPSSGPGPGPSGGGGPEPLPPGANHPPEFGEGSRTVRTVAENSPAGTDIGAPVTATDPEGDALAYKLAGSSADTFDLDSSTGQIKTKAALDYESRNSYTISVEVRDGKNPEGEPDRSESFTFTAVDDTIDDDGESVLLGFPATLPDRVSAGTNATATVNIEDDDHPEVEVSFAEASYDVDEGGSVTVTVTLDADPERTVRVPITATNLGGASNSDYTLSPATVTFGATQTTATLTLRADDDSVDDDGESVTLGFGALPERFSTGTNATATVSIVDDDHPEVEVSFAQPSYSVTEGDSVTVTVNLDADPERTVVVPITASGASDEDYTVESTEVTFEAAETSATFTFTAVDDTIDDDDESVRLGFGALLPDRVAAVAPLTAVVSIVDDDDPEVEVSFAASSYSVDEGGSVTVTVTLDADPERTVRVPITATGQGDASDSDYSGVPGSVTFTRGARSESFTFTAVDDTIDDDGESVLLGFPATLPDRVSAGTNATATVNIEDDDHPEVEVSFAEASYSVDEGGSVTVTVTLDADPERTVRVPITATGQGDASDSDYSGVPGSVTFTRGARSESFTFTAVDDTIDDDGESVLLGFPATLPDRVSAGTNATATVNIEDDDHPEVEVSFAEASYGVDEGGSVTVTVTLDADPERTVRVPITATNLGGASNSDYTGVPDSVTFTGSNWDRPHSFTFTAVDDDVDDDDESVRLGFGMLPDRVSAGTNAAPTVNIEDDDDPEVAVSFKADTYDVTEGDDVTVTVELDADPERTVEVSITHTGQGGAVHYTDYLLRPGSTELTFRAGQTSRTFKFETYEDSVNDNDESVLLEFDDLPTQVSEGTNATATVNIIDDDYPSVTVSFAALEYSASEGGAAAVVAVTLSPEPEREVRVPITVTGQGGVSDSDYSMSATVLVFTAEQTLASLTLRAVDDGVDDDDESVLLEFDDLPDGVSEGTNTTATVNIIDNDGSVVFSDFLLECPTEMAEGETHECSLSNTADGERSWPVVGLLHSSGDSDRALVAGDPVDVAFCTVAVAPCAGNRVTGSDVETSNWWLADDLIGYSRFDWSGKASAGQERSVFVSIVDDDEYEPQQAFYLGMTASGSDNISALHNNASKIVVSRSDSASRDASLSGLRLLAGAEPVDYGFSPTTYSYSVDVPYRATELVVVPVASHGRASVAVGGDRVAAPVGAHRGAAALALGVGSNVVLVTVTAEDGTTRRNYIVTVNRLDNAGDVVKVVSGGFALTCPEAIHESAQHSCTLRNNSTAVEEWPVIAVIHSSLDDDRATVASGSGAAGSTDVRLWPDRGSTQDSYNYGEGELFHGGIAATRTLYGYQKFDLSGQAAAGEQRTVYLYAEHNDDGTASSETFYVSMGPDGYTGLSTLVANKTPIILNEQTDTTGNTKDTNNNTADDSKARDTTGEDPGDEDAGDEDTTDDPANDDNPANGMTDEDTLDNPANGMTDEDTLDNPANDDNPANGMTDEDTLDNPANDDNPANGIADEDTLDNPANDDNPANGMTDEDTLDNPANDDNPANGIADEDTLDNPADDDNPANGIADEDTTTGNKDPADKETGDDSAGDGMAGEGATDVRAESPTVASVSAGETAASWASVTVALDGQASAGAAVHVRHRPSSATGTGGWASVSALVSDGSAEVALWGLEPSTAYRVEASLDPAFPLSSTRSLVLTTAAEPTLDFASEEFTLHPRANVRLGGPADGEAGTPYDRDARSPDPSRFFDVVRVDSEEVALEDLEFYVEELPDRVPYQFCWRSDTATDAPLTDLAEPLCADLDLGVRSNSGRLYLFADGPDPSGSGDFRAHPHIADYPAQRMRLSAQDTSSALKIYREFIVHPPALPVGCDDYPDSNWERYNCLFNGERPKPPSSPADQAMIDALPEDLVQARDSYSLVFSEEFATDSECENLNATLDGDVWSSSLTDCDSRNADVNGVHCVGIRNGHYFMSYSRICSPASITTAGKANFRYGYVEIKYSFLGDRFSQESYHNYALVLGDSPRNRKYSLRDYDVDINGSLSTMSKALSTEVDMFEHVPSSRRFIAHQYHNYRRIDAAGEVQPRRATFAYTYCRGGVPDQWTALYNPDICNYSKEITVVQGLEWTPRGYRRFIKVDGLHDHFNVVSRDNIRIQYRRKLGTSTPDNPVYSDSWTSYSDTQHSRWFEYLDPDDTDSILEQVGVAHVPLDIQIVGWGHETDSDVHNTRMEIDYIRIYQPEDRYATMEPVYG